MSVQRLKTPLDSQSIVRYDPLLLPTARDLRGRDRAFDAMDLPAVLCGAAFDPGMREHRQHELAAHGSKRLQQPHEIRLVERSVVVAAVAAHIGRIDEMEGFGHVVAPDEMNAVFALDNNMFQPTTQLLGEGFAGIAEFLRRGPRAVIPERAVDHRGKAQLRTYPHGPCPFDGCEEGRMGIDMPCMGVNLAAVECRVDQLLQSRVLHLRHAVEVHQFGVRVVDDLAAYRLLGEEHGTAAAEGLGIERMLGDERQDVLQKHLFAAVVGNRSFHDGRFNGVSATGELTAQAAGRRPSI